MAIADFDAFVAQMLQPPLPAHLQTQPVRQLTASTGRWNDALSVMNINTFVVPTTAVALDRTYNMAVGQPNPAAGNQYMIGMNAATSNLTGGGGIMVMDRLSHQGGLSSIILTTQTTNLPTAALPRYTTGEGVMAAVTIYATLGASQTTFSVTYTNSAGVSGRVSPLMWFGGTALRETGKLLWIPLQSGDTGVRSVESVTVTTSTGTAGAFGITLFKPLAFATVVGTPGEPYRTNFVEGGFGPGIPQILDDACITYAYLSGGVTTQSVVEPILAAG